MLVSPFDALVRGNNVAVGLDQVLFGVFLRW
jgi:hypothetical protein